MNDVTDISLEIPDDLGGKRLDVALQTLLPDYSRSRLQGWIKSGLVTLNAEACTAKTKVWGGEAVVVQVQPAPDSMAFEPEDIPLAIVFEDEHILVINKPAGLVVHPAAGNWTGTLVNALLHHCGDSLSGVGGVKRPGIVHRLDKDTSGLLVVAKNDRAHQSLSQQFADHGRSGDLTRSYLALTWNTPQPQKGSVETFLGRDKGNRIKRAVVGEGAPDAKWAVTHYNIEDHVLAKTTDETTPLELGLMRCKLETGRTHQIRVHMAHIGCPLLGDETYATGFASRINKLSPLGQKALRKFKRQALHAQSLGFAHPISGEIMNFTSDLPEDFKNLIDGLCQK